MSDAVATREATGQDAGSAANCASVQALISVDWRATSCAGSCVSISLRFAWWEPAVSVTWRLTPFARDAVLLSVDAANAGEKASCWHPVIESGVERRSVASGIGGSVAVPLRRLSVASVGAQLVGLTRKRSRFSVTLSSRRRTGVPPTIIGSDAVVVTRVVRGSIATLARVTILP